MASHKVLKGNDAGLLNLRRTAWRQMFISKYAANVELGKNTA